MTYLEAVNNVLTRLREANVVSVTDTDYSRLIGTFINDAKTQVENSYAWSALQSDILVSTVAGTSDYSLVGSGQTFRVLDVLNDTNNVALVNKQKAEITRKQRTGVSGDTAPYEYAFSGVDTNGDTKVALWPTPDDVYSVAFTVVVPQAKLVSDTDIIQVPTQPILLGAWARAIAERGEDQGMNSSEVYGLYKDALSDTIAIESSRTSTDVSWMGI